MRVKKTVATKDKSMSITIQEVNGIAARLIWTCPRCGHQRKLHLTLGVSRSVTCPNCNFKDEIMLDESVDGEVG